MHERSVAHDFVREVDAGLLAADEAIAARRLQGRHIDDGYPECVTRLQGPIVRLLVGFQGRNCAVGHLERVLLDFQLLGGKCEQLLIALYCDKGGATYEEVAAKLDMPTGSIGPARARCLRKLSDIIESMEGKP